MKNSYIYKYVICILGPKKTFVYSFISYLYVEYLVCVGTILDIKDMATFILKEKFNNNLIPQN